MAERSVQQAGGKAKRYEPEEYYDDEIEEEDRPNSKIPIIIVSVLLVAVLTVLALFLHSMGGFGNRNQMVEVPSFLGQNIAADITDFLFKPFIQEENKNGFYRSGCKDSA